MQEWIMRRSRADSFRNAMQEWTVTDEAAPAGVICICGNNFHGDLFVIRNGREFGFVGSICVNKFRRTDDVRQVIVSLLNVQHDNSSSLSPASLNYLFFLGGGWLNLWEWNFATCIARYSFDELSELQQLKRIQINDKLCNVFALNSNVLQ
uniref:Uncharacterized protein n=1 Tax=Panagrolaimus davidi TaxID=227884 RepID=A0A914QRU9_9BILA